MSWKDKYWLVRFGKFGEDLVKIGKFCEDFCFMNDVRHRFLYVRQKNEIFFKLLNECKKYIYNFAAFFKEY